MLVRVGSSQTSDELWINPDHVIYIRVQKIARTAVLKLSDGTTHSVKLRDDVPVIEADALKLLHGRAASQLTELMSSRGDQETKATCESSFRRYG